MTQDTPTVYSPEDLLLAKEELKGMTPEDLLQLTKYMNELELGIKLPEAGGVAWGTMYDEDGMEISVTSRGISLIETLANFKEGTDYATAKLAMTKKVSKQPVVAPAPAPAPSQAYTQTPPPPNFEDDENEDEPRYVPVQDDNLPAPAPAQQAMANTEVVDVTQIAHVKTLAGGRSCLRVKGGQWSKYGVRAYDEVIPKDLGYETWGVDTDYLPPDHMKVAWLAMKPDGKPSKVVRFAAKT